MHKKYSIMMAAMITLSTFSLGACSTQHNVVSTETIANVEETNDMTVTTGEAAESENSSSINPNLATRVSQEEDHYIFELNENVNRQQVYYMNRFGIEIAADLYTSKDLDTSEKHPALVIGPPFGGVKEQGPGVYANELAQRGFVVIAIDPAYHGYSGGMPRMSGSTAMYVEDFSAGVDFLGTLDYVDREKIGAIGICGSGGFSLSAAAMDTRIKAVATSVMYDIPGLAGSAEGEERQAQLAAAAQQRWADIDSDEEPVWSQTYPSEPVEEVPSDLDPVTAEFFSFYGTQRGHHPNALGNITLTSNMDLMNFQDLNHIGDMGNRPVLLVAGENAHSRGFSESTYEMLEEPKELYIVPGANHVDLYDDTTKIPFDKFEEFFNMYLQ